MVPVQHRVTRIGAGSVRQSCASHVPQQDLPDQSMSTESKPPEIIAIASGKGGTGKTLLAACLGHALARAGHSVLLVDGDTATDGLSLFLLGEAGMAQVQESAPESTLRRYLERFAPQGQAELEVRRIEYSAAGGDVVAVQLLISGGGLYGELDAHVHTAPALGPPQFRAAIQALFRQLHALPYDYVVVDTRGGSAFESTDLCALADGFILVTTPDPTSFSQDRNLLRRINAVGIALERRTVLRSILVNRARDGEERPFRLELEREFGVELTNTHAIPFDLEALRAYDLQKLPYEVAEACAFSYATLLAFAGIFQLVTAPWPAERVQRWNALVAEASEAFEARERSSREEKQAAAQLEAAASDSQLRGADNDAQRPLSAGARGPSRRKAALLSVIVLSGLAAAGLAFWRVPHPAAPDPALQNQLALQPSVLTDTLAPAAPEAAPPLHGVAEPAAESSDPASAEAVPAGPLPSVAEPARSAPPSPRPAAAPLRESARNQGKRPAPPPTAAAGMPTERTAPPEDRSEWSGFGGRK
jgi:MinD-like ATPase involved in chromosome partitioning or flagellar assembly